MRLRVITRAALLAALCSVGSATSFAQLQAGRILGTVYDPQHAGIPGATITVTNVRTNVPRMAVTDSEGNYVVTPLDPGTYRVTAEIPGFQTTVREGLELTVGQAARVELTLNLSGLSTEVHARSGLELLAELHAQATRRQPSQLIVNVGGRPALTRATRLLFAAGRTIHSGRGEPARVLREHELYSVQ